MFFIEDENTDDAFASPGWRGTVVDRDRYDWHAMPRVLWEALRESSADAKWWICGYAAVGEVDPPPVAFSLDWDSFVELDGNPALQSPEWVAYNDSHTIAVLAEFEVTIVGAASDVADDIDRILQGANTSLRALTAAEFDEPGRLGNFFRSVTK